MSSLVPETGFPRPLLTLVADYGSMEPYTGEAAMTAQRRPTLTDCGCEATVYEDGSGIELHYCPLHAAAPELLAVAESVVRHQIGWHEPPCDNADCLGCRARAAIAKATQP